MAYYGLQAQDLAQMHGATLFTPDSPGGSDEGSIAKEAARFYAKLTFSAVHAPTGITYFSWKEQQRVVDTGGGIPGFVDLPGGRFGNVPGDPTGATAFSNPIVEPNGATPSVPTIVRASRSYFDPALGMVHVGTVTTAAATGITQNLSGFAFPGITAQSIPSGSVSLTSLTSWSPGTVGDWTCDGTNFTVTPAENTIAYVISVSLLWAANSTGSRHGTLVGSTTVGSSFRAPTIPTDFHQMSFTFPFLGGSFVGGFHIGVMQDSGGNLNIGPGCSVRIYGIR